MIIEALKAMGLTGHEAQIYVTLVERGASTGYEVANATGIARANVYAALASLADKGVALKISEEPAKYIGIPPQELSSNVIRAIKDAAQVVVSNLKSQLPDKDIVLSLEGEETIVNKVINLIEGATATIYLDAYNVDLKTFADYLQLAQNRGVKVVIISLGRSPVPGILLYENERPASWIVGEGRPVRLIVDSHLMLTGELGRGKLSRGVFSGNVSLVMMAKHSFVQEIILAEVRGEFEADLVSRFGEDFNSIRKKVAAPLGQLPPHKRPN